MFIGETGAASYLFVLFLLALSCVCRAVSSKREGVHRELGVLTAGLLLLVASRALGQAALGAEQDGLSLLASAMGLTGLYIMIVSVLSGRRKGEYTPFRKTVLTSGLTASAVLGAVSLFILPEAVAGPAAMATGHFLAAAAPIGFMAGMLIERRRGASPCGSFLGTAAIAFISAAAVLSALSWTGLIGRDPMVYQLTSLLDVAGMFLFLAWLALEPAGRRSFEQDESGHGAGDPSSVAMSVPGAALGRWVTEINRRIIDGVRANDIYRDIVEAISEETGAEFVIVRACGDGDERFEVRGYAENGEVLPPPSFRMSLTRERLTNCCPRENAGSGALLLGEKELGEEREAFVPEKHLVAAGSVAVLPVREGGVERAVVVAGFFREDMPESVAESIRAYSTCIMLIAGREIWLGRVRSKEKELALCKNELASVNQMKSNFLSIVSHELRTPLTSVKAYTETLMDNVGAIDAGTVKEFLKVMGEENDRVISLVDNILNYSCMENGHLKVEKTLCDLGAIIEEVHAGLEHRMLAERVNSEIKLPRNRVTIDADRELIRQLIHNLMSNAIKFTPSNGRITVVLEEEASAARIVVQDTGRGIPEDQLEKVFERFHQVDASDTREHGGSGLGLAICKNIVDWHDGHIWVENVKEAGAKFTVMLPMKDIIVRHAASSGFIGSIRFERERYLTLLVEMLSGFLQARKASIMLLDPHQRTLQVIAAKGLDPEFVQNSRVEVGERIAGKVFEEEEALYVYDIERDSKVSRSNNTAYYWTKSFISVPLRNGDDVIGVLNVADHVDNRGFTETDREILESLGPVISGMVKKLDAYETVSSNFEKLKVAMKSILHMREIWGSRNMLNYTMIAMAVGRRLNLDEKSLTALRMGMSMYDLGMTEIPRSIRIKKEALSEEEWERLKEHPDLGYTLVSPMGLDEKIMKMVRSHHENFDGTGYPSGLMKDEIPVESRIINIVDSFRALITPGPYRRCFSVDEARNEIIKGAGTKFDPRIVGAFVKALHDLGARDDKRDLVLDAVEREIERKEMQHRDELATVKEDS